MGGEELKWCQLLHHQLMSQQGPHFSSHSKAKANYESTNLRKLVTSGISDTVFASVYSEKTCLKKMIMTIITTTEKTFTSTYLIKGDVGMAESFSERRDELSTTCNPESYVKIPVST